MGDPLGRYDYSVIKYCRIIHFIFYPVRKYLIGHNQYISFIERTSSEL